METMLNHIFTIIGAVIGIGLVVIGASLAIATAFEVYDSHKRYKQAWQSMVEFREVKNYCSFKRPEIADILDHCECPRMSTSEFREHLNRKYPIAQKESADV